MITVIGIFGCFVNHLLSHLLPPPDKNGTIPPTKPRFILRKEKKPIHLSVCVCACYVCVCVCIKHTATPHALYNSLSLSLYPMIQRGQYAAKNSNRLCLFLVFLILCVWRYSFCFLKFSESYMSLSIYLRGCRVIKALVNFFVDSLWSRVFNIRVFSAPTLPIIVSSTDVGINKLLLDWRREKQKMFCLC
jgi:hypothetical protein